jgi:hypothetical protein
MEYENEITPHFLKDCVDKINKRISRPEMPEINELEDDIGIYS